MNPFVYPEFWLSLAFIVVIGLVILPPVRRFMADFFLHQRRSIIEQIQQADTTLDEAQHLFNEAQKNNKLNGNTKEINQKIKTLQNEFSQKTKTQIEAKEQDFKVRLRLTVLQIKNHLRTQLLDQTEEQILKKSTTKSLDKDVQHLLKVLHENKDEIKESLR